MKTSELEKEQLAAGVAKALGWETRIVDTIECWRIEGTNYTPKEHYRPDLNWSQCGPISEREKIATLPLADANHHTGEWEATYKGVNGHGPTPQVAICRAFVAAKLGEEVPDEHV